MLLGSSGYSAQLAGQLGLAFGFAHHFDLPGVIEAVRALPRLASGRRRSSTEPYTIVTAGVLAADDAEQAEHLAGPARLAVLGIRTGRRMPLLPPDEAAVHPDIGDRPVDAVEPHRRRRPTHVASELQALAERTGADEIMISTMTHGLPERIRTLELVAEHWPA